MAERLTAERVNSMKSALTSYIFERRAFTDAQSVLDAVAEGLQFLDGLDSEVSAKRKQIEIAGLAEIEAQGRARAAGMDAQRAEANTKIRIGELEREINEIAKEKGEAATNLSVESQAINKAIGELNQLERLARMRLEDAQKAFEEFLQNPRPRPKEG